MRIFTLKLFLDLLGYRLFLDNLIILHWTEQDNVCLSSLCEVLNGIINVLSNERKKVTKVFFLVVNNALILQEPRNFKLFLKSSVNPANAVVYLVH